jgi:hypothetical protein
MKRLLLSCLLLGLSCTDDAADAPIVPFVVPRGDVPPNLQDLPWPSDLSRDAAGHPRLGRLTGITDTPLLAAIRDDLAQQDGFAVTAGAFFQMPDGTEPASIAGRALLLDLAGGTPVPSTATLRSDGILVIRPRNGQVLAQRHQYAYALYRGIVARGRLLQASSDFLALRDSRTRPSDARLGRAWDLFRPFFEAVDRQEPSGEKRADLICASVFTTQSVTDLLASARQAVRARPPTAARVAYIFAEQSRPGDSASLDDLMGHPVGTRPGCYSSCKPPDSPMVHDQLAFVVQGAFVAADFLAQTVASNDPARPNATQAGTIGRDDAGRPLQRGETLVPFTLALPQHPWGGSYSQQPVVLYGHGLGGDRDSLLAVANRLAASGLATIAIDLPFHGMREPGAVDLARNVPCHPAGQSGADCQSGPDGLADGASNAFLHFFHVTSDAARTPLDPRFVRSAFQQSVIDLMSLVWLVESGSFDELGRRDPRLAGLSFRRGSLAFLSESLGSILGAVLLAVEPDVRAAALVVGGGGILIPLSVWSGDFGPAARIVLSTATGIGDTGDPLETDLQLNLMQELLEPADPLAFAPYVVRGRLPGASAKNVLLFEAYEDETVPNIANEALGQALGLEVVSTAAGGQPRLDYFGGPIQPIPAPITGNIRLAAGAVTAAFVQMNVATHGMLARQVGQRTRNTRDPDLPLLPMAIDITNPTEDVQGAATSFLVDFYAGRVPTVPDGNAEAQSPVERR